MPTDTKAATATAEAGSINVLIADDHQLLLDAMVRPLENCGFDVHLANSFASACERIRADGPFDVVLLDLNMPGMDGLSTIKSIVAENAGGSVVLFSGSVSPVVVMRALEEGARGFIPKSVSLKSLENALRLVASGERFVPYSFFETTQESRAKREPASDVSLKLNERELKVLYGASTGQSNKEIAHDLSISEVTVKMHMRSICTKLGATLHDTGRISPILGVVPTGEMDSEHGLFPCKDFVHDKFRSRRSA